MKISFLLLVDKIEFRGLKTKKPQLILKYIIMVNSFLLLVSFFVTLYIKPNVIHYQIFVCVSKGIIMTSNYNFQYNKEENILFLFIFILIYKGKINFFIVNLVEI